MFFLKNYSDFYKTIDHPPASFFIGANSPTGFIYANKNLLHEKELTKLYVLKGGPGTGKSTLMKKCREHFANKGYAVYSYYCSSDPESLDALIIENRSLRIAIVDGTPPHSIDPSLPGAIGELVDLGSCWKSAALEESLETIASLAASKAIAFEQSQKYLLAASNVLGIIRATAERGFKNEKATAFISRLIKSFPKPKGVYERSTVITKAISMRGAVRLPTFENAKHLIAVADSHHTSPLFFQLLDSSLGLFGHSHIVSYSPLGEICEIYLPQLSISFVSQRSGSEYYKTIRLSRFTDNEYFADHKAKLRFNEKCLLSMLDASLGCLTEAKNHHFALEDIYVKAMDFSMLDAISEQLIGTIEKKLLG